MKPDHRFCCICKTTHKKNVKNNTVGVTEDSKKGLEKYFKVELEVGDRICKTKYWEFSNSTFPAQQSKTTKKIQPKALIDSNVTYNDNVAGANRCEEEKIDPSSNPVFELKNSSVKKENFQKKAIKDVQNVKWNKVIVDVSIITSLLQNLKCTKCFQSTKIIKLHFPGSTLTASWVCHR